MTIGKKNPDQAKGREKHVKEHLAEMTDADLDKVAGGFEAAAERDIARKRAEDRDFARKRAEELHQSMQRMLKSQKSLQESHDAELGRIIRNI